MIISIIKNNFEKFKDYKVKKIRTGVDDTFTITKQHIQYNMDTHSITHTIKCAHTTQHTH